jgi:hypothetical protein
MKILSYVSFALEVAETVTTVGALIALKQKLTGAQIESAVAPAVAGLQSVFKVTPPAPLVLDICTSAADAINKWVLKLP